MGSAAARLEAEKLRVLRQVLEEVDTPASAEEVRDRLRDRGYRIAMMDGDRVWGSEEEPPTGREIWRDALIDRQNEQAVLIKHLENQLRNSEIFRRNVIGAARAMRREIGQLLATWDNVQGTTNVKVALARVNRRIEDLRQFAPGKGEEDGEDGGLLETYQTEVREMRLGIVAMIETWDALVGGLDPGHLYLPRRTRQVLEGAVETLRAGWGRGVLREDADGAPLPGEVQV